MITKKYLWPFMTFKWCKQSNLHVTIILLLINLIAVLVYLIKLITLFTEIHKPNDHKIHKSSKWLITLKQQNYFTRVLVCLKNHVCFNGSFDTSTNQQQFSLLITYFFVIVFLSCNEYIIKIITWLRRGSLNSKM